MGKFNLDKQYQLYLKRVGLNESHMHPTQKVETKRAFMGACAQMLVILRDDLSELDEVEGVEQLRSMLDQAQTFWMNESTKLN